MAVSTGRVGYVFLIKGKLYGWRLSRQAAASPEEGARFAKSWITLMRPEVVVTEKITGQCRKGAKVKAIIEAIARVAAEEPLYDIAVARTRTFPNKFAEAEVLAERFPDLRPRLPKPRKLWHSEPRNTTIFEALALALVAIDNEGAGTE